MRARDRVYLRCMVLILASGAAIAVAFWAARRVNDRLRDLESAYDARSEDDRNRSAFGDAKRKAGLLFGKQPSI